MSFKNLHVLLIGKNGQVGWELQRTLAPFSRLTRVGRPEIDLTSGDSIRQWIRDTRPDAVVNAAAYTAVDLAESEPDLAMKINGVAPGIIAEETEKIGARLVHYSTDYVFDGRKDTPYLENDAPNPLNAYGRSKWTGEEAIRQVAAPHLIFRLCWVYSSRSRNFFLTISRLAREREQLRVVMDQMGCPTWSRMIAEATAQSLRQMFARSAPEEFTGTYHLCATGSTSWHGFAAAIVDSLNPHEKKCRVVEPISSSEHPTPARRPAYSVLNCGKLKQCFGIELPSWQEQLKQLMDTTPLRVVPY